MMMEVHMGIDDNVVTLPYRRVLSCFRVVVVVSSHRLMGIDNDVTLCVVGNGWEKIPELPTQEQRCRL